MKRKKSISIVVQVCFVLCIFIKPALCFLIFGGLILYVAIQGMNFLIHIKKKGIACTGIIIDYRRDDDGQKSPFIEYSTMSGEVITEKPFVYASTDLSKFRTYKNLINQPVPILYDPNSPNKFVLANESLFNYIVLFFFTAIGLFFIGLSISSLAGYIKFG